MTQTGKDILKTFSLKKILIPVAIGLGAATYLLLRNFDRHAFEKIDWTWTSSMWIFISFLMVGVRDLAYMYRIRILTQSELNWKKCFEVIMLWEFASAVAPATMGGGFAFAILIINKEKIAMGKSISVVMVSSFLDGLFFAIVAPLAYFIIGKDLLFPSAGVGLKNFGNTPIMVLFWSIYFIVLFYKLIVAYALFINPRAVKYLLLKIFSIRFLKKWKPKAYETGTEMEIASIELQGQSIKYWLHSFGATFISWTARYIIVNCVVLAFTTAHVSHFLMYARQVVMGLILLVVPTPGGSGFAEFAFGKFLGEFVPLGLSSSLAFLWRLISYYPYLFIGAIILPRWIRRVFTKEELVAPFKIVEEITHTKHPS